LTIFYQVLYNILDWPTKPNSNLVVIGDHSLFLSLIFALPFIYSLVILLMNAGIANTMDLPEKLLPRISSRMGIQRLCFGPYNFRQLQEIITSRLNGIDAFEEQAIEFASRKVCPRNTMFTYLLSCLFIHHCYSVHHSTTSEAKRQQVCQQHMK